MFVIENGKVIFNDMPADERDHKTWLLQDRNYTEKRFETTPRGYILNDRVHVFVSSHYDPVAHNILTDEILETLILNAKHPKTILNGAIPGKPGTPWKHVEEIMLNDHLATLSQACAAYTFHKTK